MTGRIDKIQLVLQAIRGSIGNAHGLRLDCNAAFPFKVHLVKVLLPGFSLADNSRKLQNAVSQGGLAVINVGDNAKISDTILRNSGHKDPLWSKM